MDRFLQLTRVVGVNGVALWGVNRGWSPATILIVYWFETFLGSLLVAARIALHRRLTGKRGHFMVETTERRKKVYVEGSFLGHFSIVAIAFTAAHGVFLAVLIAIMNSNRSVSLAGISGELGTGVASTAFFLLLSFASDLRGMRERPFAWIRSLRNQAFGRTFLLHIAIIAGVFLASVTNRTQLFFTVFIVLKLLLEAATSLRWHTAGVEPPPAWLAEAMRKEAAGEALEDHETYWIERWRIDSEAAATAELSAGPATAR